MKRATYLPLLLTFLAFSAEPTAQIRRDPTGVNVNSTGATTVFITFGNLRDQVPAEALWCRELMPAAPDIGFRCRPGTILGRLPLRFDRSTTSGQTGFTDIMSIPPSVVRRVYQAAQRGEMSSFFYVRRFVSLRGGPDEYAFVTCRMAGGGARVPLSLLDVRLGFETEELVQPVPPGEEPPPLWAEIVYNGTGRLVGRWEVVLPGEEPPGPRDLLTEATLPVEQRGTQRRYAEIERFNVFLPPTGRYTLPGPQSGRLPTAYEGLYLILLRIEASADKEGDSNLANAGAGTGVVHSGGVAGFPIPPLRYFVGSAGGALSSPGRMAQLFPTDNAAIPFGEAPTFSWTDSVLAALYRLEVEEPQGGTVLEAVLQPGAGVYRSPAWLAERAATGILRWRVVALGPQGGEAETTPWRTLRLERD